MTTNMAGNEEPVDIDHVKLDDQAVKSRQE
jgi:hypothetical protein